MEYAVELHNIVKRFPGVLANDQINLSVEKGEIRALVGENGAGKSTLMNILYGLYHPDEGEIRVWSQPRTFHSPLDAIRAGLGMVHQHFMLFPSLTVAENVIYGVEPARVGFVENDVAREKVNQLAEAYGLQVDPTAIVGTLPVGIRQRVEILKTLYRNASILILDEPTAVLTPQERDTLFVILRRLADQGKTILFITHKLNEVMSISDNATVLRSGKVTATLQTAKTSPEEITHYMVGRNVMLQVVKEPAQPGAAAVLSVNDVSVENEARREVVRRVSFEVQSGEIVGIAGVAGNGQTELVEALAGLRPVSAGRVQLDNSDITQANVDERRKAGIAYIPEDRSQDGLALGASVADNLIMGYQNSSSISKNGLLQFSGIAAHSRKLIKRFAIKVSSQSEMSSNLSGGNLQKLVVAREMSHNSRLLIAEQPTRGVDVGAIEFVHASLVQYRDAGNAVLLVSSELSEIMGLSDRILVVYEGEIVGEVPGEQADEETLGLMMAGAKKTDDIAPHKNEICGL